MAPHSSTLAWKIPWMEEPGGLQSMGSIRVRHDEWLNFHFSLPCIGKGNGNPLQCSCLENPRDGGAWWAAVYGVAQSQTRLKRLSSSSSIDRIMWFFFISLLMWISIEFQMLNQPCLSGINLTWIVIFVCIVGFDLLIFCWVFCICIHVKSGL